SAVSSKVTSTKGRLPATLCLTVETLRKVSVSGMRTVIPLAIRPAKICFIFLPLSWLVVWDCFPWPDTSTIHHSSAGCKCFGKQTKKTSHRSRAAFINHAALIRPDQPHSLHGAGGLGHVQSFGLVLSFYTGLSYNSIYW